ncbi:exosortase D [Methyloprofundus sedimenti]|uniref:Exosortase D n=1 Tax=Methyloprofundus sedimenti TaxID=1420851 RepID=A0A1V8M671_9GAMM|nr:VPLPA-CTERM-specific exosortase XrtD [Methyloprofundus sedimenti]OQK17047.1 exosortase D [Methyloprofundus sedimenti]
MSNIKIWQMGLKNWAWMLVALSLLTIVYWGGIEQLIVRWDKQEEYSHGYMLPFLSLYFIWLKKYELQQSEFSPSWLSLFIVIPALAIFLVGEISALFILIHYSLIAVLIGMAFSIMGWPAVKPVLLPLLLLIFAIPIPYFLEASLSANLQLLSSQLGVAFIRWCQIPVFLEGNVIDLGVYKLQVVEACSGLRYLFPLMSLGFICAYLFDTAVWKRVVVFLSTIPITLMMNSFRIGMIGVLVDNWGISMAEGFLHDFEGWIIFMACMVILFIEMFILNKMTRGVSVSFFEVFGLMPVGVFPEGEVVTRKSSRPLYAIIVLLAVCVVVVNSLDTREEITPERKSFPEFPDHIADWTGGQNSLETNVINALQLSDYIMSDYSKPDSLPINFYVAYYQSQRKGVSPHSPRVCIPGGGWQISGISRTVVNSVPVNRIVIKKGPNKELVYYWFQQRGRLIANEYVMKWYLFEDALLLNRTDGALVRITTPVGKMENIADADKRLTGFLQELMPVLPEYLPE